MSTTSVGSTGVPTEPSPALGGAPVRALATGAISGNPGDSSSRTSAPASHPTPPPAGTAAAHHTTAPVNDEDLSARVDWTYAQAWQAFEWHGRQAYRWEVSDTWLRLVTAAAASLSALSLVASNGLLTAALAVLTAIASAFNVALDPSGRAARHRRSANDYRPIARSLWALSSAVRMRLYGQSTTQYRDGQYFEVMVGGERLTPAELADRSAELRVCEDEIEAADESAPQMARRSARPPRTRWGLHRMERRLALLQEAAALQDRYDTGMPVTPPNVRRESELVEGPSRGGEV